METIQQGKAMNLPIQTSEVWEPGKPGIFSGIENSVYHTEVSGLSRSMAENLVFKSPAHMRYAVDHPEEATDAMQLGTLVHLASLELERMKGSYYVKPDTYPSKDGDKPWHGGSNWCKDWLKSHDDKPVITKEEQAIVWGCYDALHSSDMVHALLTSGEPELSVFAKYSCTSMEDALVKCRPDLIAIDKSGRRWIVDLKKCQDASAAGFIRHARSMRYDFQQAWYTMVLEAAGIGFEQFVFIAVEEKPPHGVGVFQLSPEVVKAQEPNVARALELYSFCVKNNYWPGYAKQVQILDWRTSWQ